MTEPPEPGWGGGRTDPYAGRGVSPEQGGYAPLPGYAAPPPGAYRAPVPPESTSGLAIAAFACSIAAFAMMPIIGAVVALVLAHFADDEIRRSGGRVGGQWMVTAARVISWIHIALAVLLVLFVIAVIGAFSGW